MFPLNTIIAWSINIIMNKKYDNNNIIIASRAYFLQRAPLADVGVGAEGKPRLGDALEAAEQLVGCPRRDLDEGGDREAPHGRGLLLVLFLLLLLLHLQTGNKPVVGFPLLDSRSEEGRGGKQTWREGSVAGNGSGGNEEATRDGAVDLKSHGSLRSPQGSLGCCQDPEPGELEVAAGERGAWSTGPSEERGRRPWAARSASAAVQSASASMAARSASTSATAGVRERRE
jgi:hypothetical protein